MSSGRVIVVGDIHGCHLAFEALLNYWQLVPSDVLVVLGDALDRGPDSRQVLERMLDVGKNCQLVYILGNHEEMLLDTLAGARPGTWLRHGGAATLESYGGSLAQIPDSHLELLSRAVPYVELATAICVHANLEPGVELKQQRPEWLRWQSLTGMEYPHPSGKLVCCGHTGQASGIPRIGDGWVCLDTLAYTGRHLSCLELDSGRIVQSRQTGGIREIQLRDLQA